VLRLRRRRIDPAIDNYCVRAELYSENSGKLSGENKILSRSQSGGHAVN